MARLPVGTVTFLYTDIEGSTRYWEQQPENMRAAVARHDELLKTTLEAHHGQIFRRAGDAFCAVYSSAPAALAAAVEAQLAFDTEPWQLLSPLRIRLVVFTGEADVKEGDYVGASLNRIGRLLSVCHGGQILISASAQELVRDSLPPGVSLKDLGEHRFRDLVHPERIYQVVIPGLAAEFPPLASMDRVANNLPVQLTRFIGRERELAEIDRLLRQSHLITLTGPGGTGKTRLAVQVGAEALENHLFSDGVWLVELAPLNNPELVYSVIASALNVRALVGRPIRETLVDHLFSKNLLLLLDNCEHLIETCAEAASVLLSACPGLKILASSREPLGTEGEAIFRVPSFSIPPRTSAPDILLQNEAVQMFVDRARSIKQTFSLTEANASAVLQICRRLDGIPLAIELAAARIQVFSPEGIATRLDDRFHLLTGGRRSAMPRQQTLESLIDWSYDLLSRGEKELFQTLSVFVGGFTFEAAEAVCGAEVLDLLAQLVNKSLVQFEEDQERYRMLETMRQYARVKLLQDGDVEDARDRHLRYFHEYTRGADEGMQGSDVMRWMQCLIADQDNIRAALEWALDRNPQLALQMCNELTFFWIRRGFSHEAQHWLSEAFQRSEDLLTQAGNELRQSKIDRARGLFSLGQVFTAMGDYPSSQEALVQSIDLWREIREPAGLSRSLGMLGVAKIFTGEWEEAQKSANEGLAIGRQVDDDYGIGLSLSSLGQGAIRIEGNPDKALFYMQEALVRLRKRGNDWIFSTVLMGLGLAAFYQGQVATSRAHLTEALEIFQRFGDRQFSNITRSGLADLARLEKNASRAVELYLETLAEWRDMGNRGAIARCLECLAFVAGDLAQADEIDRQKHLQTAGRLLGAAQSLRESSHTKMILEEVAEYERNVTALHQLSQGNTFQLTLVEGNTLSVDQAIALASKMLED